MTEREQIEQLADEIDKLLERSRSEYDLSYAAIVGVLQMKIHLVCEEAESRSDEAKPLEGTG